MHHNQSILVFCFSVQACPHLFSFFQGLCQLCLANFLQQEANHLQLEADCLEAEGLQEIQFTVAGLEVEGLYDLLWGAMTKPDLSASVGLPLPKRCKWAATAMVLAWQPKTVATDPPVPMPKGGISEQGGPPYPSLSLRRQQYLLEWNFCKLMRVIPFSWPSCPNTFFNTDALWWHGKWAHPSWSPDPI